MKRSETARDLSCIHSLFMEEHGETYSYLVGCLVEELFVRFDTPNLSVIVGLSMFVERVLQPLESHQKDTQ